MRTLKVNWGGGGRLVLEGPHTGLRYEYVAARDNGFLAVQEEDVPGLLALVTRQGGCHCNPDEAPPAAEEKALFSL